MGYQIRRVDDNQAKIVKLLRDVGASVLILSEVGRGCPDILIGYKGINLLAEIKDGSKPPSARQLTVPEKLFFEKWKGQACVIETEGNARDMIWKVDQLLGRHSC